MVSKEDNSDRPWVVPVTVADIPEDGQHIELEADTQARQRIARLAGVRGVDMLKAKFDLVRRGASVKVTGEVAARVEQTCVVSLEPMESQVAEAVDLVFSPGGAAVPGRRKGPTGKSEPHEPMVGGIIDLGAVATEFLILGTDPYPRKPDAKLHLPAAETDPPSHPFAALDALKKR